MKKFLKWTLIIFVVLLLILIAVPFLFKDKIVAKIKEETNKNINAKVDFGDFDLSLIRNFPNVTLQMENLSVINVAPFAGDTLVYSRSLDLTLDIMSIISGDEIVIRKVNLDGPVMNFLVNKDGVANWDIVKDTSSAEAGEPSAFKASLRHYSVNDGFIVYRDETMPFLLRLEDVDHSGSGDFTQDLFVLRTNTTAKRLDLNFDGVPYIYRAAIKADADIDMDMKNMKFTFKDNRIGLNELNLGFSGWLAMPDTNMDMDLKFSAAESEFRNFLSMIPAVYSESFKDVKASGTMGFEGFAKGRYNGASLPGFGIKLNIDNGAFQYPSLPSAVKNVNVDLNVSNPDGNPDHTLVNLSRFHMEMNNDPFDARLVLKTPVSDPDIDAFMKGKIDLSGIQKLVPLEKGTTLSGIITADVTAKGRMSSIEKKQYEAFQASGNLGVNGMTYASADMKPFTMNTLQMSFSPQRVALSALTAKMGNSDFAATGSLDNMLGYALKDEVLRGSMKFNSTKIDLNDFMGGEEQATGTTDTTQLSVLEIPANIDFTLAATIGTLVYEDLNISNVNGTIVIRDQGIRMNNVGMGMLGGNLTMNGGYSSVNPVNPAIDFSLNVANFDIQQTVKAFNTVEQMAPIAKNCTGKFSTTMTLAGMLDKQMNPVVNSLSGAGKLTTSQIVIQNFPAFVKVADALKMDSWKSLSVPPVNPSFRFSEGRVFVEPFDMNVNGIKATVAGSNGFDQSIDYTMTTEIPRSAFGGAANSVVDNLMSKANKSGANLSVGDVIPVGIRMTGTVNDPKVSTDLNTAGAKVMDDLKAKAAEEFDRKKAEAEAKAREEAEKLKKAGEARLEEEKQKAAAEAEKKKKEAEAKAKATADSLKKAAEKKAKESLKDLNPFKK